MVTTTEETRVFLRRKELEKAKRLEKKFKQANSDFKRIVKMIVDHYSPDYIYQWGSLLDKRKFSDVSDIDIAVSGLKTADAVFRLLGEAEDMTDFPLDIVELERLDPLHRKSIKQKGRLVYERGQSSE